MSFNLTILGCSSATPTTNRNPTAQVLNILERFFLIDCGEATQIQMRRYKIRFQKIDHIFISHLHGDHYLGLPGLLSTMHLLGRTNDLHIHCNEALKEMMEIQFKYSDTRLKYKIIWDFLEYDAQHLIYEDKAIEVYSFPLNHRIPCCGFVFKEKQKPYSIIKEKIIEYDLEVNQITDLKEGKDVKLSSGKILKLNEATNPPKPSRSYAYASDTIYDENIVQYISETTLLYHEATFMNDLLERAKETYHTTSLQVGVIAQKANVKQLIIGHYSARYHDLKPLLAEAKINFENTLLAEEGHIYQVE